MEGAGAKAPALFSWPSERQEGQRQAGVADLLEACLDRTGALLAVDRIFHPAMGLCRDDDTLIADMPEYVPFEK